jgi:hypothetical protein
MDELWNQGLGLELEVLRRQVETDSKTDALAVSLLRM